MTINFYKKIIIGTILAGLIFNPAFLLPFQINKAEAVLGVADTALVYDIKVDASVIGGITAITGAIGTKTVTDQGNRIVDTIKKVVGALIKKIIIDRLMDRSVEWILKGGFEGKGGPIVEDWGAFFQQAGEDFVGELANKYVKMLCGPFQANVAFGLLQPQKFSTTVECSLNDIVDNVDNFFKDFNKESKGRWLTYNAIWQPQNNFYGSTLAIEDHRQMGLADILNQKNVEATVNLGFKPQRSCKTDNETGNKVCKTLTPGQIVGHSVEQAVLPTFKSNAILNADDIAGYVGALFDAVFYRYGLMAFGGAKGSLAQMGRALDEEESPDDVSYTGTAYADWAADKFSRVNQTSFDNTKALYLDEIDTALKTKRDTLTAFNEASATKQDLINKLTPVANCDVAEGLTDTQSTKIYTEAPNKIDELNTSLSDTETRMDALQDEIDSVQAAYDTISGLTGGAQSMDEVALSFEYNSLKFSGILDSDKASQALSDAQAELASARQDADIALNNNSNNLDLKDISKRKLPGYKDVIGCCLTPPTADSAATCAAGQTE